MEPEQFVNDVRAAEILSCSVQTLRNYRHLGKGSVYFKRFRMVRYAVSDLIAYMNGGRIEPERRGAGSAGGG